MPPSPWPESTTSARLWSTAVGNDHPYLPRLAEPATSIFPGPDPALWTDYQRETASVSAAASPSPFPTKKRGRTTWWYNWEGEGLRPVLPWPSAQPSAPSDLARRILSERRRSGWGVSSPTGDEQQQPVFMADPLTSAVQANDDRTGYAPAGVTGVAEFVLIHHTEDGGWRMRHEQQQQRRDRAIDLFVGEGGYAIRPGDPVAVWDIPGGATDADRAWQGGGYL